LKKKTLFESSALHILYSSKKQILRGIFAHFFIGVSWRDCVKPVISISKTYQQIMPINHFHKIYLKKKTLFESSALRIFYS
jgi:hypothetical protein